MTIVVGWWGEILKAVGGRRGLDSWGVENEKITFFWEEAWAGDFLHNFPRLYFI